MHINENSTNRGCRTSAIQLAQKCPFACQKIYGKEKVQGCKNEAGLFGSMLHDLLEEYGIHCLDRKFDTDYDYFDSIIDKHVYSLPANLHREGLQIAYALKDRLNFAEDNHADFATVEIRYRLNEKMEIIDDSVKDAYFSSGIDRIFIVDGVAYVSDYKSYRKISTRSELEINLQKDYYPYLVFAAFPEVHTVEFVFDFIRYGYTCKPFVYHREEDFERLKASLRAGCALFYEMINTEQVLEARPSGFCFLCECPGICPAVNNAFVKTARIRNEQDAVNAARELKAGEKKLKMIREALSEHTNKHGSIAISNTEEYGRVVEHGLEINDMYGLVMALLDHGVKKGALFDNISISQKKLKALLKAYDIEDFDIKRFARPKMTTKMMYKDKTVEEEEPDDSIDN